MLPGVHFPGGDLAQAFCWAPDARSLDLVTVGNTYFSLEQLSGGWWKGTFPELKPGTRYFLELNGEDRYPDPASLSQPDGVHGASEVIDLNAVRSQKLKGWRGIPLEDLIIYELHVGTFTPLGTFAGVVEKLPYLQELGVNAIELMPVATFPGCRNWGYDGVFPYAVQHSYGGAAGLANLIHACHCLGMAVILDVVYNHIGPEGNVLGAFGPYFTRRYTTPWGRALNYDGKGSAGVRSFFLENALMWLRDFDVDGLRLDAIHTIFDISHKHFLQEMSEAVSQLNASTDRIHFLIGESDLNDPIVFESRENGGFGLDAQWCDDWHHSLHALLTSERKGYYQDFGKLLHLVKAYHNAFVYDGIYSTFRKRIFGKPAIGYPGTRFVVFTQNHDQTGNRAFGERLTRLVDFESLKLAAGALIFSPFVPMLFMGEEYGEDNPFLYFTSHGSERLAALVRAGRKRDYRFSIKQGEPPDPQAEESFRRSKLKWDFSKDTRKNELLAFYKTCISLRKSRPYLFRGERSQMSVRESDSGRAMIVYRNVKGGGLLMVFNFSKGPFKEEVREATGKDLVLLLNSSHRQWGGSLADDSSPYEGIEGKAFIALQARSFAVFFLPESELDME
ncbi:MAG: malto-oligosyltrehalose trehalohydrolase [Bacteroidales bacterium]|jgi:maltooligosyltrehalose trehalohydrolase|nr:malto-oligosyltrehalose trehalohydrolase [Bacteroidales bacterium]